MDRIIDRICAAMAVLGDDAAAREEIRTLEGYAALVWRALAVDRGWPPTWQARSADGEVYYTIEARRDGRFSIGWVIDAGPSRASMLARIGAGLIRGR